MSLMHLALNENLTPERFQKLCDLKVETSKKLIDSFAENYNNCDSDKMKSQYLSTVFPLLIMSIF